VVISEGADKTSETNGWLNLPGSEPAPSGSPCPRFLPVPCGSVAVLFIQIRKIIVL
jgi:hypothetical protein